MDAFRICECHLNNNTTDDEQHNDGDEQHT